MRPCSSRYLSSSCATILLAAGLASAQSAPPSALDEAAELVEKGPDGARAALPRLEALLTEARARGDRRAEARALLGLGAARRALDEYASALAVHDEGLRIARELGDTDVLKHALNRQGTLRDALGQRAEAVESYTAALDLLGAEADQPLRAQVLSNLGSSLSSIGRKARAIEALDEALALRRKSGPSDVLGQVLLQLGRVHASLGDPDRALALYREALAVVRAIGHRKREADALNNVGTALAYRDELGEALSSYAQALPIYRELEDVHGQASVLNNAGWAHDRRGDFATARSSFEQAVALFRQVGARANEAQALTNLGRACASGGDPASAVVHLTNALAIRRDVKDPRGEAQTLFHLARAERDRGRLAEARAHVESALGRVEDVRAATPGPRLRAAYLATAQDYYALLVEVLLRQHADRPDEGLAALALETSERARARSLLDLLAEGGADIRAGVDPALLEREAQLRHRLSRAAEARARGEDAGAEIAQSAGELDRVEALLRAASPRYAELVHPRLLGLSEIQRELLDPDTVLLQYALGETRSHVFTITRDSMQVHELAPRATIESAARALHERLQAAGAPAEAGRAAAALAALVLGPAAARLDRRRLLVVADGALEYVPFAALPDAASDGAPLVARLEVVHVPSASVLGLLRRERADRRRPDLDVAVLADPVFAPQDARVGRARVSGAGRVVVADDPLVPALRDAGFAEGPLPRLPGTRREAAAILSLVPRGRARQALDFDASRDFATSAELGRYRIVHFATHGVLDSVQPELSGIVLSLVDRQGRPTNGFLRMHELYALDLPADLVVLSACRTALGREVRGEGLVGLTRGFMSAGASRVMASLWTVDDRATAELMTRFYRGLLGERLAPPAALRAAQQAVREQSRWRHPYYWAGFVLHGDWK